MPRLPLVPVAAALLVAACSPAASDMPAGGATPPADAPATAEAAPTAPAGPDFARPINALGTEPFWGVEIRRDSLRLSGPDRKDLVAANGGPAVMGETAVWEARAADGSPLKVTLTAEACSDGMSDRAYPYRARVETTAEMLNGCAAPLEAETPARPR